MGRPRVFLMDLWATVPYYTAYLAKALAQEEVGLTVGSITYYLDPECFSSRGVQVNPGLINLVGRLRVPRLVRRVLKLAEGTVNLSALAVRFLFARPDVIHVQYLPLLRSRLPLDLWFVRYCGRLGSKVVLTVHDLLPHDSGDVYRQTFTDLYAMVDGIICHSEHIRTRLEAEFAVHSDKVSVIPHGPFFYDLPANGVEQALSGLELDGCRELVLWQGILFPYKGVDVLLRAWRYVQAAGIEACLVIAGTGPPALLEQVRAEAGDMGGVKLHFRFVSTEELVALYRAADVVVYPYRAITTSGALATGLALGKTIVASDLPVFRELLTDRENALLVAPEDAEALAGALIELLADRAARERLAGRVKEMDFGDRSWLSIAEKTMEAYRAVLSR